MLFNCGVGEDSWESLGLQGDPTSPSSRSVLSVHWKDWCWSWNSNALATWCKELTHLKRPWYWERLRAGGEGDDREWDGWIASLTQWIWVWINSQSWRWTGKPDVLQSMGSQRVRHSWATELNWFIGRSNADTEASGFFGHLLRKLTQEKTLMLGKIEGQEEKDHRGWDGWRHHRLNGHEFEQIPGDGEGHGSLVCCSQWDHKESDWTVRLNNSNKLILKQY